MGPLTARTLARGLLAAALLLATPSAAVSYQPNAPGVNGFTTVDKITWKDSKGLDREFFFARSYPGAVVPSIKGYVTRLTWKPDSAAPRIIAEEDPSGINASNAQGWGTNVMHMHWSQYGGSNPVFGSGFSATTSKRDGFNFTQAPTFQGPHHLIFRVTYDQYTTLQKAGVTRKSVKVTVDWFFADGLDYVIYAITLDASAGYQSDPVAFMNNTLAPYSLVTSASWKGTTDWAGGSNGPDGQGFGDQKVFVSNDMRNWTYGGTNTIPYIWQWVSPSSGRGNAEAAYIQTETYAQKQAGEGFNYGNSGSGTRMPVYPDANGQEYAYQMNYFDNYGSKRMTWGTRFGIFYGGAGSTPGYINYSLAMAMGKYTDHRVSELLRETQSFHDGMISVQGLTGTLLSSGREGSGNPTPHTYSPLGYNHVYRTWDIRAASNVARLRVNTGAVTYTAPTIVVHGFTGTAANVTLNGAPAAANVSLDDPGDKLYVTLLATLAGANVVEIAPPGGGGPCTPTCAPGACGSDGCGGVCACPSGAVCLANQTCCTPNNNTCGPDGCGGSRGPCCTPSCAPGTCGSDGCGGQCACAAGALCLANSTCCTPNNNACGPDGCGGSHGPCCTPSCAPGSCGSDGCGGTCACASGARCLANQTCCAPSCAPGTCGSDGCGGTCACAAGATCQANQTCCTPSCAPNTCGSDGCGGTCGCSGGALCLQNLTCCQPNNNSCGPDGCGGSHGECPLQCLLGDQDWDAVCDDRDNCTGCWNPEQLDVDHDGLGDCWRCDWCDGPGTDTDWDGFCDGVDNCPTTWNQSQRDSDRDGIGDACDPTP